MTPRRFPPRPRLAVPRPVPVHAAYFDVATMTWIPLHAWNTERKDPRR